MAPDPFASGGSATRQDATMADDLSLSLPRPKSRCANSPRGEERPRVLSQVRHARILDQLSAIPARSASPPSPPSSASRT